MRTIKIILLIVLSMTLAACAMLAPEKSTPSVVASKTAPEQATVDLPQDTDAEKPAATPSIVDTQSADIAASMSTPVKPLPTTPPPSTALASRPSLAEMVNVGGQQGLSLNLPYQQAWVQAKKALPQVGYPIMEQDSTSGTYYILDKVGTGGVIKRDTPIYQLHLQKSGDSKTTIILNNAQNQPAAASVAERILGALKNKLAL